MKINVKRVASTENFFCFFFCFLSTKSVAIFRPHQKCNRTSKPRWRGPFFGRIFRDHDFVFFFALDGSRNHHFRFLRSSGRRCPCQLWGETFRLQQCAKVIITRCHRGFVYQSATPGGRRICNEILGDVMRSRFPDNIVTMCRNISHGRACRIVCRGGSHPGIM